MSERNYTTPEGYELGAKLAKFCDDAEPKARLRLSELPPRCNSCAFRQGRHLASGSPFTQMDALKAVMEGVEFHCHEPAREGHICSGWAMMMLANDKPDFREVPWPFSNEGIPESREAGLTSPAAPVSAIPIRSVEQTAATDSEMARDGAPAVRLSTVTPAASIAVPAPDRTQTSAEAPPLATEHADVIGQAEEGANYSDLEIPAFLDRRHELARAG